MKVAISFLKSKYSLEETLNIIETTDAEYVHVDVMDGKFVPNSTEDFIYSLKNVNKTLDVHLMVENPIDYIIKYKELKPEYITIHSEINYNIEDLIDLIKSYNIKVGVSIKPKTSVKSIEKILPYIDNVLIMSVEPGFGGQKFMDDVLFKIEVLNKLRKENNYNYVLSIDGGINDTNIDKVRDVDFVISGSFICMSDNYQEQINKLR